MNGTVVDIQGIDVSVTPIELQYSTDISHLLTIKDTKQTINIIITNGTIQEVCSSVK